MLDDQKPIGGFEEGGPIGLCSIFIEARIVRIVSGCYPSINER